MINITNCLNPYIQSQAVGMSTQRPYKGHFVVSWPN